MDIAVLTEALEKAPDQEGFESWLATNFNGISTYLYNLPLDELVNNFDNFYFGTFLESASFKDFHRNGNRRSEPFDAFLLLLASAAERIAGYAFTSALNNLLEVLPGSSIRYRLRALIDLNNINNVYTDYIALFQPTLNMLEQARQAESDVSEYHLVDILIWYYKKARTSLSRLNATDELTGLRQLFASDDIMRAYPYVAHPKVQTLIYGEEPVPAISQDVKTQEIIVPSPFMLNLFDRLVNSPVLNDVRSNIHNSMLLGYDSWEIINEALLRGRADFREGYKLLSPAEKVQLYCYFNMKKHYCTSVGVFRKIWPFLNTIFTDTVFTPLLIDVGCGPLTSGLALADLYHTINDKPIYFKYIGIDVARPMLDKAIAFFATDLFAGAPEPGFFEHWNEVTLEYLRSFSSRNHPVIVSASYFFASDSLDPVAFANFISILVATYEDVYFIFQNPQTVERNLKYGIFKQQFACTVIDSDHETIRYKTKQYTDVKQEEYLYEILKLHLPENAV